MNEKSPQWRYLAQESAIFLALSYTLLLGGTFNGLVRYDLNKINSILITLLGGAWLLWRYLRGRPFSSTVLDGPLLGVAFSFIIASAASADPRRSAAATCLLILVILVFYLLVDLMRAGWETQLFIKSLIIASGFILFFGLWELARWWLEWLAIGGLGELFPPATIRLRAFLGHPNFVAAFLNLVLPLGLAWAVHSKSHFWKTVLGSWAALSLVTIFFTSSRGGWLGTAAALGCFLTLLGLDRGVRLARPWHEARRRWIALALSSPVLGLAVVLLVRLLQTEALHPTHGSGFGARSGIWSVAWQAFVRDPLTGSGPFTYGTNFITAYSFPPMMLLAHAHSLPLNVLGETGLLGLAALVLTVLALVKLGINRWQREVQGDRWLLIGVLGSFAGLTIHSLFDLPESLPAISLFAALLAAILACQPRPTLRADRSLAGNLALGAGFLLLTAGVWWALRAYAPFSEGVLAANLGSWKEAGPKLDRAADLDPDMAFYHLQAGYAHGRLALDETGRLRDAEELSSAIARYELGLALEPSYATNWANLGVLAWAAGDRSRAVAALETAVEAAPDEPAFQVTLGSMYEKQGRLEPAGKAYQLALDKRPDWSRTYFFRATDFRQNALGAWSERSHGENGSASGDLKMGWAALDEGDFASAQAHFERASGLNTPEAYLGSGLAWLGLGDLGAAEQALRTALFSASGDHTVLLKTKLALGTLEAERGDYKAATSDLEAALDIVEGTTSLGLGTMGQSDYGWYIFNRESILPDLLPGVEYLRYTDDVVEGMVHLGDCYKALGKEDGAVRMYEWALEVAPDWLPAQRRLDDMSAFREWNEKQEFNIPG